MELTRDRTSSPAVGPGAGMHVENPYCVRYVVDGRMMARQGAMVAYRGELAIRNKNQGLRKLVKRAVTGGGIALMEIEGRGEMWLADLAKNVRVVEGDGLSVAGKSVLCFDESLQYDIHMIKGSAMSSGGVFNCSFSGAGSLAITSDGEPMTLPVTADAPVFVDTKAIIGWTRSLGVTLHRSESLKSMMKGGSGEMYQLRFEGEGTVLVQPSEGPLKPKGGGGAGDAIGDLFS